jgi:hypothetical protein
VSQLTRARALAMRAACLAMPDMAAYSAAAMLLVIDSYIKALEDLEKAHDALELQRLEQYERVRREDYDA